MVQFWQDDFEGTGPNLGGGDRVATAHADQDNGSGPALGGNGDYFFRTNLASDSVNGLQEVFSGFTGSYWRGEDVEDSAGGAANPALGFLNWTGIDITGQSSMSFSGLFGGRTFDGSNFTFEASDFITVRYSIDGGAFANALTFRGTGIANAQMAQDSNLDGVIDLLDNGTLLSDVLANFSFNIAGSGSTLALQLETNVGASEEIAFDTFSLDGAAANSPAVAQDDAFSVVESGTLTMDSLFADNGSGADNDPDVGDMLTVTQVNGVAANVDMQITLPSGALLTVNSDGTFVYDPNGAFDALPSSSSGASNMTGMDSFTYELSGDDTATVNITVNGEDSDGDVLTGTAGSDFLTGGIGGDTIDGLGGSDVAVYINSSEGVIVGVNAGAVLSGGDAAGDTLTNIEGLIGSEFDDELTGNVLSNALSGSFGDDFLNGAGGNDNLMGNGDNDTLVGGTGADILNGGDGTDTASYANSQFAISANLTTMQAQGQDQNGGDTLTDIENLTGSNAVRSSGISDILTGDNEANVLEGLGGNDRMFGMGDSDTLIGGSGSDILDGGADNDFIYGGADNDFLSGGSGDDFLRGDGGTDRYIYGDAAFGADTIIGFENGSELLDFRGSGLQLSDLTIVNRAATTTVEVTGAADYISLVGVLSDIDASDFIFDTLVE